MEESLMLPFRMAYLVSIILLATLIALLTKYFENFLNHDF